MGYSLGILLALLLAACLFFSPSLAVTQIMAAQCNGNRTVGTTDNQYKFEVTLVTGSNDEIVWCNVAISNDQIPSTDDYWLHDNLRCLTGTCPKYEAATVKSKNGLVQVLTVSDTDTTKAAGKFAIVGCTNKQTYFCQLNADQAPGCFAAEKHIVFGFVDGDPVGFRKPTQVNITAPPSFKVNATISVAAALDVPDKHMTYRWRLGSQTFTGKAPKISISTPGTFTLSVNVTSIFGPVVKNMTVTVTTEGGDSTGENVDGGAIAAGILVPLIVIAAVAGAVVYLKKTNRLKLPTGLFKK